MKLFSLLIAALILLQPLRTAAADDAAAKTELSRLVEGIKAKLKAGKSKEQDFAEEIKGFDVILEKYKGEKTDDAAQVLVMKAMFFMEVLEDLDKAKEVTLQIQRDFPDSTPGKRSDAFIQEIEARIEEVKMQKILVPGNPFPDFTETGLDGKPLSIAQFKGKMVLVDFWATWCGPCIAELPNVIAAYQAYRDKGFEIIGISLDREKARLEAFLEKHPEMKWPQFFDSKAWQNKLAVKYAVRSIPATYLLDREGKIVAKDLRGEALDAELKKHF